MFSQISGSQHACYLSQAPWSSLLPLGQSWVGAYAVVEQDAPPTLEVKGQAGRFRAERYVLRPEQQPWEYLLTFTQRRNPSPLDPWQQVRFARQVALRVGEATFCDLPPELGQPDPAFYWQLQLNPTSAHEVEVAIARLEEQDGERLRLMEVSPMDLRNFEMYQLFS